MNKAAAWNMIKRLAPTFDPKDHGHASLTDLVKALDAVIEIKKGELRTNRVVLCHPRGSARMRRFP